MRNHGNTVWHLAAETTFRGIPKHLFTSDALAQEDGRGQTVWVQLAENDTLKDIPEHLINKDLLKMKNLDNKSLFNTKDRNYIKKVLQLPSKLTDFINKNPAQAKDIEHRDSRFVLEEANDNELLFKFTGIEGKVILNKEGAYINNILVSGNPQEASPLSNAVTFIEKAYNIEQSISLPKNSLTVEPFVL